MKRFLRLLFVGFPFAWTAAVPAQQIIINDGRINIVNGNVLVREAEPIEVGPDVDLKSDRILSVEVAADPPGPNDEAGGDEAAPLDRLDFLNQDRLTGLLQAVHPAEGGVVWKHPGVDHPIRFALSGIAEIVLAGYRDPRQGSPTGSVVRLTNGDILVGRLLSLDDDHLNLETPYAGTVHIQRLMIRSISPNAGATALVFEGPTGLDGWSLGARVQDTTWRYKNRALYSTQSYPIGRMIDNLPDTVSIEFVVGWQTYPAFNFSFFTDNVEQSTGNCYQMQVSSSSVYVRRYVRNQGSVNLWNQSVPALTSGRYRQAHFRLLVDKAAATFCLFINDEMVKQWTDPNGFAGGGKGILFQPQRMGGMKFADIRITAWDGSIPQPDAEQRKPEEDLIRFVNRDKVSGKLLAISDAKASMQSPFATLDVPLTRISEIVLAEEKAERARRYREDVRATFAGTGAVTVRLGEIADGRLQGYSENFGDIALPMDLFNRIEFNIYAKRSDDEEFEEDF